MNRSIGITSVVAAIFLSLVSVNEADAFRRHRGLRSRPCVCSPCCRPDCYGDNQLCVQVKIIEVGADQFLYYAEYYEGSCEAEVQDDFPVLPDIGDFPLQICDYNCIILLQGKGHTYQLDRPLANGTETVTPKAFEGFTSPLPGNYQPKWGAKVTQVGDPVDKYIHLAKEGRTYKARIFELQLGKSKTIYVAMEVGEFSEPAPTSKISILTSKRLRGQHAYSMQYDGKKMLFLVDTSD